MSDRFRAETALPGPFSAESGPRPGPFRAREGPPVKKGPQNPHRQPKGLQNSSREPPGGAEARSYFSLIDINFLFGPTRRGQPGDTCLCYLARQGTRNDANTLIVANEVKFMHHQ